ncbi:MAG TPA: hypothetical protein VMJ70_02615 [Candidatus Sulfotelmatobacter sp.]|nr:hypothetical protein [Candidatus Sulfotelmatobacter sp.]
MSRHHPVHKFWERLLPPYRERDWDKCLRELRPVLDADEDAIVPRMLCAAIHQAAGQPALALLQYETLLPLAVGQGDFLRALAVQKHLDELHPAAASHAKRYEVLQRWFQALGQGALPQNRDGPEPTPAHLLMLDSASFTRVAAGCEIEGLDPAPRRIENPGGSLRFVLYGRTRWSLQTAENVTLIEGIAEQGDAILVDPDLGRRGSLITTAELPGEHLVLGGELLGLFPWADEVASETAPARGARPNEKASPVASAPAAPAASPPPPIMPLPAPAPAKAWPSEPAPKAAAPPPASADRPRPDPRFEPMIASSAPVERRRETRLSIQLKSGVVRLGLADTRVAPLSGRLVQFTAGFVELAFARSELRHLRSRLEGSFLNVQLNINPREELLLCVGRVRYTTALAGESGSDELRIEVEFMPLPPRDQARIEAAVQARLERQRKDPESRAA